MVLAVVPPVPREQGQVGARALVRGDDSVIEDLDRQVGIDYNLAFFAKNQEIASVTDSPDSRWAGGSFMSKIRRADCRDLESALEEWLPAKQISALCERFSWF